MKRIGHLISLNLPMRIRLNPGQTMVVLEALERYSKHCEQNSEAREEWLSRGVIHTIYDIQLEIGSRLIDIDAQLGRSRAKAHDNAAAKPERHSTTRYYVHLDLDPDGLMILTEALARFLARCEQDRDNSEMKPFGSQANAARAESVREDLIRAFRKTWQIRVRVVAPRFSTVLMD